jgi:hypothetical protein
LRVGLKAQCQRIAQERLGHEVRQKQEEELKRRALERERVALMWMTLMGKETFVEKPILVVEGVRPATKKVILHQFSCLQPLAVVIIPSGKKQFIGIHFNSMESVGTSYIPQLTGKVFKAVGSIHTMGYTVSGGHL